MRPGSASIACLLAVSALIVAAPAPKGVPSKAPPSKPPVPPPPPTAFVAGPTTGPARMAVMLTAKVSATQPSITLNWLRNVEGECVVFRRESFDAEWKPLTPRPLPAGELQFTDADVTVGKLYEYQVTRAGQTRGVGYICSGIELPAVEQRGKVVLIVEQSIARALPADISTLVRDLAADGWEVIRHDVARDLAVPKVKELIQRAYEADRQNVRAVYLLGHVPVPYSGNQAPDGHADHVGAWPADGYYGDMDGAWTDATVTSPEKANARQKNVPGDGKFDQMTFPSDLELEVGRVDLSAMPAFPRSEIELIRAYLGRARAYRHAEKRYPARAIIGDNFFTRGFSQMAWRMFPPIVGGEIHGYAHNCAAKFSAELAQGGFLWAYALGPGNHTGAAGVTSTAAFGGRMSAPFWMTFGSYFGDWDVPNSLLRAPLAGTDGLINAWAGFPNWYFHPMAMGHTAGLCARLSMNNGAGRPGYAPSSSNRGVHTALMGDPTLRWPMVAPPWNVTVKRVGAVVALSWNASADTVIGYHVYRADQPEGPYTRLTREPVRTTSYGDPKPSTSKSATYIVRAAVLSSTPSGSFHNLSVGAVSQ